MIVDRNFLFLPIRVISVPLGPGAIQCWFFFLSVGYRGGKSSGGDNVLYFSLDCDPVYNGQDYIRGCFVKFTPT